MVWLSMLIGWWAAGYGVAGSFRLFFNEEVKPQPWFSAAGGVGFALVTLSSASPAERWTGYILVLYLVTAATIDLSRGLIPNRLNLTAALFFVMCHAISDGGWIEPLLVASGGAAFLLAVALLSRGGMGGGDIKMVAASGVALDWTGMVSGLGVAIISGGFWSILLLLRGKAMKRTPLPFAPHLAIGFFVGFLWGEELVQGYLSYLHLESIL
ncbi:MAG: A24 family peptidase [Firmicutes bacterium]|nr:A24 family peptidase [Bacillota bacterium]